jgi:hypothetical protein
MSLPDYCATLACCVRRVAERGCDKLFKATMITGTVRQAAMADMR